VYPEFWRGLVPESIRSAVGQRFGRLSKETQDVLRYASVLGQTFFFDDLLALMEHDEGELEGILQAACHAGLLSTTGGDSYAFDHALTRQALYAEVSPRRRRKLHLAAGEAIESLPERTRQGRVAELAWHFLQAHDQERSLRYSLQAADAAAAIYAHTDAALHYRTAAELAAELEDEEREGLALERRAEVLYISSRHAEQLEIADQAASIYRRLGDLEGEGRVIARTARGYLVPDRKRDGIERLETVLQQFEGEPASPAHVELCEGLVTLYALSGMLAEAEDVSERALEMARVLRDERLMARALGRRAFVLNFDAGREAEAEETHLEAVRLAESVGDLDALFLALNNAWGMYMDRGELARSSEYAARKLTVARRVGSPGYIAIALGGMAWLLFVQGDVGKWRAFEEERLQLAQRTGLQSLSGALLIPGWILLNDGHGEAARAHFEHCMGDAERTENTLLLHDARASLASVNWLEGQLDAAREWYEAHLRQPDLELRTRTFSLLELAALLLEMKSDEATLAAKVALDQVLDGGAGRTGLGARMQAAALSGWLQAREGNREEATRLLEESLAYTRRCGAAVWEGMALIRYGLMLADLGETASARERLTQAVALFARIGMVAWQRYAERLLTDIERSSG